MIAISSAILLVSSGTFSALARADQDTLRTYWLDEPGLVAAFLFDGDLSEATGNFGAGHVIGNRVFTEHGGSISFAEGVQGDAVVLNGASGVRLPDGLIDGYTYSVSLWVKPEAASMFTTTFFGGYSTDGFQRWISFVPVGPIGSETMVWSGNDPWYDANTGLTIPLNEWSHLALTVDHGKIVVYVNGVERFSGTGFPDVFAEIDPVFALAVNYWDAPFTGMIDHLRIYDVAIGSDRVAELAAGAPEIAEPESPFRDVTVHDPEVIRVGGTFYIFGSHLAVAKSQDLIVWEQLSRDWARDNPIIPNPGEELREAMLWPQPNAESTWAKSVIELNGQFYMFFSAAHWYSPGRSAIAIAIAEDIEGPYRYDGMILKGYGQGAVIESVDGLVGERYDIARHPGVIDPHVFFDTNGVLWMVYGSYAGGIHIIELDPADGRPKPGQGYGVRIAGGNHAPMEGPFIQHLSQTGYYYLMVSFGTLAPGGGYDIRVARSKNPYGPFLDPSGKDLNSFIDHDDRLLIDGRNWRNSDPFGAKLLGNFRLRESGIGYVSPGHSSMCYDEATGQIFAIFHSRFPGFGHMHNVRVHQLFLNQEGWLVMAPHRYAGETIGTYSEGDIIGTYQYINHGTRIQENWDDANPMITESRTIELEADGAISGDVTGTWELTDNHYATITIDGEVFHGVFLEQWDNGLGKHVMAFTALSDGNVSIWGSRIP